MRGTSVPVLAVIALIAGHVDHVLARRRPIPVGPQGQKVVCAPSMPWMAFSFTVTGPAWCVQAQDKPHRRGLASAVGALNLPDLKILHDAAYNVLTYDLRNHGLSGSANGGISASGWFEARDVAGSLRYARHRDDTRHMTIGLFSRCLGCNSTFAAMTQYPGDFDGVRCLVGAQPVTTEVIVKHQLALAGVPAERLGDAITDLDQRIKLTTSLGFAARDNREWAKHVTVPTFLYGVHDDVLTETSDLETMHANLPATHKSLHWVRNTTARWDGYLEFQRRPQPMLDWLNAHIA